MTTGLELPVDKYRILVVDDDDGWRMHVRDLIEGLDEPSVVVRTCKNLADAKKIVESTYLDLVVVDLVLNESGSELAFELTSAMATRGNRARIVMVTQFGVEDYFEDVVREITPPGRVIGFFTKAGDLDDGLPRLVRAELQAFDASSVDLVGREFVAGLIAKRSKRYPTEKSANGLRSDPRAIETEVDRLCRRMFGTPDPRRRGMPLVPPSVTDRKATTRVELTAFERHGLSASVVVGVIITTDFGTVTGRLNEFRCILKIGPAVNSEREVSRYNEYVRFGIELEQRVELLASAVDQGMGAIAYSFAGGVYHTDMQSLDDLLSANDGLAEKALDSLFVKTLWYGVGAPDAPVRFGEEKNFPGSIKVATNLNKQFLSSLIKKPDLPIRVHHKDGEDVQLWVGRVKLTLPGTDFLGRGWTVLRYPRCLVHGDMHGGNVMAKQNDGPSGVDVCLIDYRSAGPGPRCLDAVALEGSIRIADAEEIGGEEPNMAEELSGGRLAEALNTAVRRYESERQLYWTLFDPQSGEDAAPWRRRAKTVALGIKRSFEHSSAGPVTREEYLTTAVLYASRQLYYSAHTPLVRIRLCTWLAALYSQLKPLVDPPARTPA